MHPTLFVRPSGFCLANCLVWKRYVDYIFFIWQHGTDKLEKFVQHLNNCYQTIRFTLEISPSKVNFLDITVFKDTNNKLQTTLYCKPADSHNYLLYSSQHPRHLLNGIPYAQFLRVKHICSDNCDFRKNCSMFATHFACRGYPLHILEKALQKAELADRETLIAKSSPKPQNDQSVINRTSIPEYKEPDKVTPVEPSKFYFVTTHNPSNPPMKEIIMGNWPLLELEIRRLLCNG